MLEPLVEELVPAPDPSATFRRFSRRPFALFLDSAARDATLGRWSFLASDPFDTLTARAGSLDPLAELKNRLARYSSVSLSVGPPFQGGAAGLIGYDLACSLERIPAARFGEFDTPAICVGFYDVVLAFDHFEDRAWIVSHGWPESDPVRRRRRAAERLEQFRAIALGDKSRVNDAPTASMNSAEPSELERRLSIEQLAPQFPTGVLDGLTSNFTRDAYLRAVERAVEYIVAGDIFQVNLAQRLLYPAADDSVSLYLRLRERNPAPFAGYFDPGPFQIVSASPERFLRVTLDESARQGALVETRPIKGTRRRLDRPEADLYSAGDLEQSDKDRAENVMIVDLMRNDLSRVCRPDSVRVTQLCRLESYQFVQHLVSAVEGRLAAGRTPLDLLQATFPGGSITGAPKVRAMEIIAELEPTARGAYCGSLGYIGFDGAMDLSILIRTITASQGWWQLPAGGGIVAASDPKSEYEETWHKAHGMVRALK